MPNNQRQVEHLAHTVNFWYKELRTCKMARGSLEPCRWVEARHSIHVTGCHWEVVWEIKIMAILGNGLFSILIKVFFWRVCVCQNLSKCTLQILYFTVYKVFLSPSIIKKKAYKGEMKKKKREMVFLEMNYESETSLCLIPVYSREGW